MSKLKDYGFALVKQKFSEGEVQSRIVQQVPEGSNSVLNFINRLDKHETESFIFDLERCLNSNSNVDEGFFSDSVEDIDIFYQYPNVNIDNILLIPMSDMKMILVEWLNFAYS